MIGWVRIKAAEGDSSLKTAYLFMQLFAYALPHLPAISDNLLTVNLIMLLYFPYRT